MGVSKQEGAGTVQDMLFLLIKILMSMWPPGYAAQQVSSVLSRLLRRASRNTVLPKLHPEFMLRLGFPYPPPRLA